MGRKPTPPSLPVMVNFMDLTRRSALLSLAGAAMAPSALAAPGPRFPLRIACMRVGPSSFLPIRHDEQGYWSTMQVRLGALAERVTPIQPTDMLGTNLAAIEGGPSCAMAARQAAARWGLGQVILYATQDGQQPRQSEGVWWNDLFAALAGPFVKDGRATGEAHLLDVDGGPPLASATADAPPRDPFNLFDGGRNPERETLTKLTEGLERGVQDLARAAYENQRSIGD